MELQPTRPFIFSMEANVHRFNQLVNIIFLFSHSHHTHYSFLQTSEMDTVKINNDSETLSLSPDYNCN